MMTGDDDLNRSMTELTCAMTELAETFPGNDDISRLAGKISRITGRLLGLEASQDTRARDDELPWWEHVARHYERWPETDPSE